MAPRAGSMKISSVDVVEGCSLKETDTIIAIIGATGAGKSTFVKAASGRADVEIGHQLEPCTREIIAYRITFSSSRETVVLIDTPGYGWSSLSDKAALENLFKWLQASYAGRNAILLSGILYMHRISDNPETCSPLKHFEIYEKLCGEDPLRKLTLVTTIWDLEGGENFEHENESHLREEYQLRMERFVIVTGIEAHESAWNILNPLIHANIRRLRMAEYLAAKITPSPDHCQSLLLKIASNEEKRQVLCALRNNDAQMMVDYMNLILCKLDISKDKFVGQVCSLLCKFSKSARVFPKSFKLSGIKLSKDPEIKGGFAIVCKGTHRRSGQAVAVKTMLLWELQNYRMHLKELSLWAYLSHPNILPFYGVYCYGSRCKSVAIISPWMDKGNLNQYTKGRPQDEKLSLLLDVARGLLYLHELNIVHGDLKGANILVSKDLKALIADFGISRNVTTTTAAKTVNVNTRDKSIIADSRRWTAPEIFTPSVTGPKSVMASQPSDMYMSNNFVMASKPSDIWAFGCVVYEIISETLPYKDFDDQLVIVAITRGILPGQPHGNDRGSDGMPEESVSWHIAKYCWDRDHTQRPICSDVLTFFTKLLPNIGEQSDTQDITSENSRKFRENMSKDPKINLSQIYFLLREASDSGDVSEAGASHGFHMIFK